MTGYLDGRPDLKYIFFGGKGGVGKTVMAGATAVWTAEKGRRTLLASTNPVHSLSGLLDQNVFGRHTPVTGVPNLFAYEIDTKETIERSKREIREKIQWFLKFAEISTRADEFVESATMNPAFEESAMFENMIDLMFRNEYDVYVFDTAPTANARRLLGMSKVYSLWVNKMMKSREEAQSLREMLSFTKKKEQDPLMEYLVGFRGRMEHARELLTDAQKTAFFFVTLPEAAHRRHHPLHQLVPRVRHPGRRRPGEHADRPVGGDPRKRGVRAEPAGHAGRAHADDLGKVRFPGARHRPAVRRRSAWGQHAQASRKRGLRSKADGVNILSVPARKREGIVKAPASKTARVLALFARPYAKSPAARAGNGRER
jgi:TRC40/GET3/ArsA family transport-energizing ATPase